MQPRQLPRVDGAELGANQTGMRHGLLMSGLFVLRTGKTRRVTVSPAMSLDALGVMFDENDATGKAVLCW